MSASWSSGRADCWRCSSWSAPKSARSMFDSYRANLENALVSAAVDAESPPERAKRFDPAERPRRLRAGLRLDAGASARSLRRPDCDRGLGKSDRFDHAIAEFAAAYADLN